MEQNEGTAESFNSHTHTHKKQQHSLYKWKLTKGERKNVGTQRGNMFAWQCKVLFYAFAKELAFYERKRMNKRRTNKRKKKITGCKRKTSPPSPNAEVGAHTQPTVVKSSLCVISVLSWNPEREKKKITKSIWFAFWIERVFSPPL